MLSLEHGKGENLGTYIHMKKHIKDDDYLGQIEFLDEHYDESWMQQNHFP